MHPVALDIVVRRVPRNSTSPQDIRAASAYEVRLQDGAWTGLVVPDDAGWAEDAGGLLEGEVGAARRLGVRLAKQLEEAELVDLRAPGRPRHRLGAAGLCGSRRRTRRRWACRGGGCR